MNFTSRFHLSLKKGKNVYIFWHLFVNYILLIKWKTYKFFKGIHRPVIHLYVLCWNEEKIIPFMLDYYYHIVDKYVVYDNESSDRSLKLLSKNEKVEIVSYKTCNTINDLRYLEIKNNAWKRSRGHADYVIVIDMDEFLYHPALSEFLLDSLNRGISYFHPDGYDMYSNSFPKYEVGVLLTDIVKEGRYNDTFSKSILFDPHKIVEINYSLGAHEARPWGVVKENKNKDFKLLHYKNLSVEYVLARITQYRTRLSKDNLDNNCGIEYLREEEKIKTEFEKHYKEKALVI